MIQLLKADERDYYQLGRTLRSAGHPREPMRKRYRELNERLVRHTEDLELKRIRLADYLTRVGYTLHDPLPNGVRRLQP